MITLGAVSVLTFCSGAMVGLAEWTTPGAAGAAWFPVLLMGLGAAGMWATVRLTPR